MLAAVSLRGGEVVIQETRIVLRKCDARPWLALPQILIQGTCWQPVARLPSGLHREVEALALAAWETGR